MLAASVVFVDLETTGANPVYDRIIEIGIVKVVDGTVEYEWQQLVNPGQPIPPTIQGFTGITDAMVEDAPSFEQIAQEVLARLEGSLFVAHNARFDHGFLKNEFRRLDMAFQPRVLCTVKLSRALYPEHHRHGLDALIARHNLRCDARHRALGDARALWEFVQHAYADRPCEAIEAALAKAGRTPSLPSGLEPEMLDAVPEGPGVYVFYGENDLPLYVGKSVNMRSRVAAHFAADHTAGRAMRIAREVRRIDWIETAGELGALLKEAQLIKEKLPIHNRHLRRQGELCSFRLREAPAGAVAVEAVCAEDLQPQDVSALYGLFRTRREANKVLRELAEQHQLCHARLGLEAGKGACLAHQLKRCRGACAGRESVEMHDLRLRAAFSALKLRTWAYPGRIAVHEQHPSSDRAQFHLVESWCYLGSVDDEADLHEAAQARLPVAFDVDIYKILTRYLTQRRPRVIRLPRRAEADAIY